MIYIRPYSYCISKIYRGVSFCGVGALFQNSLNLKTALTLILTLTF